MKPLILTALCCTLLVIALGAYTRLTDAGLGCPDWPGCYGHWTVPSSDHAEQRFPDQPLEPHKAWNEMIHRYLASTLGLLIVTIAVASWRRPAAPKLLPSLLLALVIGQGMLGMLTVTMMLMPLVVTAHLLGGFATLMMLALLYWRTGATPIPEPQPAATAGVRWLAGLALAAVVVQIMLGAWTSSNYAALVCHALPVCESGWWQQFSVDAFWPIHSGHASYQYGVLDFPQRITIHASHRLGAMVVTGLVLPLIWWLWRAPWPRLRRLAPLLLLALTAQIGLGVSNVLWQLPLPVAVAHNLGAALLLLAMVRVNYCLWLTRVRRSDEQSPRDAPVALRHQPLSAR